MSYVCFFVILSFNNKGYTIRFDDKTTELTYLRYVTDGILVREILNVNTLDIN